ncbi:MAG: DUF3862 domain-containing protein [Candidatus Ratteibacteria bacterium]|jgi:hypothetical protein
MKIVKWVIIGFVLVIFVSCIASMGKSGKTSDAVTMEKFNKIENGMSYREVVGIIGSEGELMSQNHMDGVTGVMNSIDTAMYGWKNKYGSNMNATFQNDKLMSKAQFGLK